MPRRHFKKGERSMQRLYRFSFSFMMVSLDCEKHILCTGIA